METTAERDNLRYTKIPLTNGSGVIPALGFGTLIPDPIDTKKETTVALEAGFRQFDSSERYVRVWWFASISVLDQFGRSRI